MVNEHRSLSNGEINLEDETILYPQGGYEVNVPDVLMDSVSIYKR